MIKWTHIKGDPHIKGVCDLGIWYIRVNDEIVNSLYRMWGDKTKYVKGVDFEELTIEEAKEEAELLTEIYTEIDGS